MNLARLDELAQPDDMMREWRPAVRDMLNVLQDRHIEDLSGDAGWACTPIRDWVTKHYTARAERAGWTPAGIVAVVWHAGTLAVPHPGGPGRMRCVEHPVDPSTTHWGRRGRIRHTFQGGGMAAIDGVLEAGRRRNEPTERYRPEPVSSTTARPASGSKAPWSRCPHEPTRIATPQFSVFAGAQASSGATRANSTHGHDDKTMTVMTIMTIVTIPTRWNAWECVRSAVQTSSGLSEMLLPARRVDEGYAGRLPSRATTPLRLGASAVYRDTYPVYGHDRISLEEAQPA